MTAPWIVSDELWKRIEPLLPVRPANRTGPEPLPDRPVLQGIWFVLSSGVGWDGWEDLPQELSFGSGAALGLHASVAAADPGLSLPNPIACGVHQNRFFAVFGPIVTGSKSTE